MIRHMLIILILMTGTAAAADLPEWNFKRDILWEGGIGTSVELTADSHMMGYMNQDGADIRISSGAADVPYLLMLTTSKDIAHDGSIAAVSSVAETRGRVDYDGSKLLDGEYDTVDGSMFMCDPVADPESCWVIVNLTGSMLSDAVKIWSADRDYTWTHIMVEGSDDLESWDMIKKKTAFPFQDVRTVRYPPLRYQYLRFTLWHSQALQLGEIEVHGGASAKLVFFPMSQSAHSIYYGNLRASAPHHDTSRIYTDRSMIMASMGEIRENPAYKGDFDGDGMANHFDVCPYTPDSKQTDSDGDGVGDACDNCPHKDNGGQADRDRDIVGDVCDNCPETYNPDQYDDDADGTGWVCDDNDQDQWLNTNDNCPLNPNRDQSDRDKNGVGDVCEDFDGDGIPQATDNCVSLVNPEQKDTDRDGIGDACDNCPSVRNRRQTDADFDGMGDECDDRDGDGVPEHRDNCLDAPNKDQADSDGDGIGDACDNCPTMKNPDQRDYDRNGVGYICDDRDGDGIINTRDNCEKGHNPDQADRDNDGVGDACTDADKDGVIDYDDNCPKMKNADQRDGDNDGLGDACDKTDDRISEWNIVLYLAMGLMVVGLIFMGLRMAKKKLPDEKDKHPDEKTPPETGKQAN